MQNTRMFDLHKQIVYAEDNNLATHIGWELTGMYNSLATKKYKLVYEK